MTHKVRSSMTQPLLSQAEVEALLSGLHEEPHEPLDGPLTLTIEFRQQQIQIQESSQLTPRSTIELPPSEMENCEVWVNHQLVAYGKFASVNDHLAICITRRFYPESS